MSKYKKVVDEMLEYNQDVFLNFKKLHDTYVLNPQEYQSQLNSEGEKVMRIIRRYEDQLCKKSESGAYNKFSTNLSDKFWEEIRKHFSHIDAVGKLS